MVHREFVAVVEQVGDFSTKNVNGQIEKNGGNVATYFCSPSGRVINAVLGPVDAAELVYEAQWAIDAYRPQRETALHFQARKIKQLQQERIVESHDQSWGKTRRLREFLVAHSMEYLDRIYQPIFKDILGEKLSKSGLTVAQAAEEIRDARESGRPLLFVIHDQSDSSFHKKWRAMTSESRAFDRGMKKQLADFIVINVQEDQQAALSREVQQPPFESPTGNWPLFVVATSEGKQIDAISGKWCSHSLAKSLATNWIDAIAPDRYLTLRQVKLARVAHGRVSSVPVEKFDALEERVAVLHSRLSLRRK